jgi:hypothetical protein
MVLPIKWLMRNRLLCSKSFPYGLVLFTEVKTELLWQNKILEISFVGKTC